MLPQGRPMMAGLAQRLAQQGPQGRQPQQPMQGAPQGAPQGWGGPGMGNGWLQPALQRMGQALGAQAWGGAAPAIQQQQRGGNPDMGARGLPPQAAQTQGMAQRYAQGAQQGLVNEEDPRFNGMR